MYLEIKKMEVINARQEQERQVFDEESHLFKELALFTTRRVQDSLSGGSCHIKVTAC